MARLLGGGLTQVGPVNVRPQHLALHRTPGLAVDSYAQPLTEALAVADRFAEIALAGAATLHE